MTLDKKLNHQLGVVNTWSVQCGGMVFRLINLLYHYTTGLN